MVFIKVAGMCSGVKSKHQRIGVCGMAGKILEMKESFLNLMERFYDCGEWFYHREKSGKVFKNPGKVLK